MLCVVDFQKNKRFSSKLYLTICVASIKIKFQTSVLLTLSHQTFLNLVFILVPEYFVQVSLSAKFQLPISWNKNAEAISIPKLSFIAVLYLLSFHQFTHV